jgi:hypothetical protein
MSPAVPVPVSAPARTPPRVTGVAVTGTGRVDGALGGYTVYTCVLTRTAVRSLRVRLLGPPFKCSVCAQGEPLVLVRRFSDFERLREALVRVPGASLPLLPEKRMLGAPTDPALRPYRPYLLPLVVAGKFRTAVVDERRRAAEALLQAVLRDPALRDHAVTRAWLLSA